MSTITDGIVITEDLPRKIEFLHYTPENASEILTRAVYKARFHPDYSRINVNDINEMHTRRKVGEAKYSEQLDSIIYIKLKDSILKTYGIKNE